MKPSASSNSTREELGRKDSFRQKPNNRCIELLLLKALAPHCRCPRVAKNRREAWHPCLYFICLHSEPLSLQSLCSHLGIQDRQDDRTGG
jgi:hypothetical protein